MYCRSWVCTYLLREKMTYGAASALATRRRSETSSHHSPSIRCSVGRARRSRWLAQTQEKNRKMENKWSSVALERRFFLARSCCYFSIPPSSQRSQPPFLLVGDRRGLLTSRKNPWSRNGEVCNSTLRRTIRAK
ncbi:hypothetical protein F441_04234 [Phytophthora nicotianae CJ01A1]|uniref:Uncharacterized protein n=4 Tax=Phytophthora nicotianae TaxID=4792 RepID=W2QJX8_PHYN3|nr:hypothetical protein PPTG_22365 [Phytophthora nicotianae INRA-310]ETL45811.1 hypothetical protein L916_04099 [Phytophthora nicotianae]ETN13467.1 hypothetical protein PPTG_22365 [Phytophthora nicotianae INRA-310]ETP22382.1 hypothetical protein F441_04234 [Phytophthora nicotianae CJ01A1]ETP50264.1 hypothetical protein F442_04255 [Phytophthora nicotianae P10297]